MPGKKFSHLENILSISEELFFLHDYDSVSMNDIARSANITKAALYYHFKNKTDLYLTTLKNGLENFKEEMDQIVNAKKFKGYTLEKKIEKILNVYFEFIQNKRGILRILVKKMDTDDPEIIKFLKNIRSEMMQILKPVSEEILARKKNNTHLNHEDVSLFFLSMVTTFIHEYCKTNTKTNSNLITKKITNFILS